MTFKANYRGMHDLLNGPEVIAILLDRIGEAEARAVAIAPVETGRYKDAFEVGVDHKKPDRPRAWLRNNMWYAIIVEFGAEETPRHRTLGKALSPELY